VDTGKEEYLYSAILVRTHTLKALRHGSHSFTCKQRHACLSFVSVHQMALPLTEAADIELQLENVPFPPFTMTLEDHPALLRRFRDFGAVI